MQTITQDQLTDILLSIKGATPVSLSALTDAGLLKTGNPYPNAMKFAKVNGMLGAIYENSVNRQREREHINIPFEVEPLPWGKWYGSNHVLIEHKGKLYVRIQSNRVLNRFFVNLTGTSLAIIPSDVVKPFIPVRAPSKTQGTDKEIFARNYTLQYVNHINLNGAQYRIRNIALPIV